MADTVVITRPAAQAGALATQLGALGFTAVRFPLLEIRPLDDPSALKNVLARLEEFAFVAFVSPNAIDATFAWLDAWPLALPLAVMGEGSRQALARHGVTAPDYRILSPADPLRTDSETLLQTIDVETLRGGRVLILRGEAGREFLADALRAEGVQVEQVAAYRRTVPRPSPARRQQLRDLLDQRARWIITSSEALQNLFDAVQDLNRAEDVAKLQHQKIYVSHHRIAQTARSLGLSQVVLTASGDAAMLTALQSCA